MSGRQVAVVMSGFPRLSETFALGELLALEARGALGALFATKPGENGPMHPGCEPLLKCLQVLPEGNPASQAAFIAEKLKGQRISGIHGYFAHTPAEVAARAAALLDIPYGFSCHARDARKVMPDELARRARRAACIVACNVDVARELINGGATVHLLPHGVDLSRFRPSTLPSREPLRLLAVGRLVEKKGFHVLLEAVARFRFPFHLRIIGEGPERGRLARLIVERELQGQVTLDGERTHAELPQEYRQAHLVIVPSIQDQTGDRDGLPNVILEAMASGRTVLASDISAIGSAVTHGETGLLIPPGEPLALAAALEKLYPQPALLDQFGHNGRMRVERDYEVGRCAERFQLLLESVYV